MTVKELMAVVYEKIVIYKATGEEFEDIYKGGKEDIPPFTFLTSYTTCMN